MLLYLDDVLGRLIESVAASGLADSTYILLTADNGPALPKEFVNNDALRLVRLGYNTAACKLLLPANPNVQRFE
jgi:arylsulfatase A-like enzyme